MPNAARFSIALVLATLAIPTTVAHAQAYPNKPIHIIVNNAPGITPDILARALGPEMSKLIGQPIIVENKPGAAGAIAYEYVAKQMPADGYTLIVASHLQLAIMPFLVKDLRFDPLKDLTPAIGISRLRYVFAASTKLPGKTFNEVIAYAKANPGKLNIGSSGAATQLLSQAVLRSAGLSVTNVPYKAGSAYQMALVANEVQLGLLGEGSAITLGNRVSALAVTGDKRSRFYPNVPTLNEVGIANIPGTSYELSVRTGTPAAIIDRIYMAARQTLQQPEMRATLENNHQMDVVAESPAVSAALLAEQGKIFANLVQTIGLEKE